MKANTAAAELEEDSVFSEFASLMGGADDDAGSDDDRESS